MNAMTEPPVVRSAWVGRRPDDAFAVFTQEIGAWWPLPTHGVFGSESGGVSFRDGRLVETATDGREVTWGEVRAWEPPDRLVVSWHPGGEPGIASEVEVTFESDGSGTRVVLEHRGWEAFGEAARDRRRRVVGPNAWGYVLDHFADGAEPVGAVDLSRLEAAYDGFFAEAERGAFGDPPSGEWGADEVIAHMALNDMAMANVCQGIVHERPPRFVNDVCQAPEVLESYIAACGDRSELLARGRRCADRFVAALRRLSTDQLESMIDCRLLSDGEVMLDGARPWGVIAVDVQSGMHLPAHAAQLADLRRTD